MDSQVASSSQAAFINSQLSEGDAVTAPDLCCPDSGRKRTRDVLTPSPPPTSLPDPKRQTLSEKYAKRTLQKLKEIMHLSKKQEGDAMSICTEDYQEIQEEGDATAWQRLQMLFQPHEPHDPENKCNTDYRNTFVCMDALHRWQNFPTFDDIENFSKNHEILKRNIHKIRLPNAGFDIWFQKVYNEASYFAPIEESSVAQNMKTLFSELMMLIRLACVGYPDPSQSSGYSGGVSRDTKWVTIGGGKCAMKRRKKGTSGQIPDLVAYWNKGSHAHLCASKFRKGPPGANTKCVIVGDFKVGGKFYHSMIEEKSDRAYDETRKVFSQIHDYMDMHHNRYGYIITQGELIMLERSIQWGQLNYSPPIPISAPSGKLNALMVLWYFHVKYAVMDLDKGWRLESNYESCPTELLGDSIKPRKPRKKKSWKQTTEFPENIPPPASIPKVQNASSKYSGLGTFRKQVDGGIRVTGAEQN